MAKSKEVMLHTFGRMIRVHTKSMGEVRVKLADSNPKTVEAIWAALPFESKAEKWGDEVYFKIPVKVREEKTQTIVKVGEVAYWPPGESMCIFFGPTPASEGQEPRAYSPVNVFGRVIGDPMVFRRVESKEKIRVERES